MGKKHIFIVNPKAGNGKSMKFIKYLISISQCNKDIMIAFTNYKGHATNIASYYSEAFPGSIIYSVGGDGTLNEIVNGINDQAQLSVIPSGSGNDFYKVFKDIPGTKKINLGIVNNRKFINIASIGIDAKIADDANQIKEQKISLLSYPRAILKNIIEYTPDRFSINGHESLNTICTICNGKYYGSGIPINPNYDLNNNYFNIIQADKLSRKEILVLFSKIFKGSHLDYPKVSSMLANKVDISSANLLLCNVDGEIFVDNNFSFQLVENGITVTNDIPQYVKEAIKILK